jgi:hypothetical protein
MCSIEQLGNLMERPALPPSLPHHGLLGIRVVDARAVLHQQHSCCSSSDQCVHRPVESAAKNKDTELVIKGQDGRIRQKDSQGNDPRGGG